MSMELIDRKQLQIEIQTLEDVGQSEMQFYSVEQVDNAPTVKAIPIKQLEEMYEKYKKLLWKEQEDVRGDDMIMVGYAEQFLQDLLCELGCWDSEVEQ